jgi:hypothetical protein
MMTLFLVVDQNDWAERNGDESVNVTLLEGFRVVWILVLKRLAW